MSNKDVKIPRDVPAPAGKKGDRRRDGERGGPPKPSPKAIGQVGHDDLGNAVWNWRVDVPRRRDDDPTLDLLDCLDVDGLALEDDESEANDDKFNPYNKRR